MATLNAARALELLGTRAERTIAHATTLRRLETGDYAVKYHATDVVTLHPDNSYTLRTGGWYSPTTKSRIGEFAPVHLHAHNGLWYTQAWRERHGVTARGTWLFTEGMRVDTEGVPLAPVDPEPIEKAKRKLDRQVSQYIAGFVADAVQNRKLNDPGNGDCWGCLFRSVEGQGNCLGLSHLTDHFSEQYYVPSLAWNAVQEKGYKDPSFIWSMIQRDLQNGRAPHLLQNALSRYFRRRKLALLGLAPVQGVAKGWQG